MAGIRKHQVKGAYRYFFRWKKSIAPGASSIRDEQPWITFKAIDFLDNHIRKTGRVFEFGGGGSSLFLAKRAAEIITAEHDEAWFGILNRKFREKMNVNWKGILVPPGKGELSANPDISNPLHYSSNDKASSGFNFKEYASAIDQYPDAYFDCVIIDGRSRPSCIKHAIPKLKKGGFLLLDNSDREYYLSQMQKDLDREFEIALDGFGPCPYLIEYTKTSIWRKK